MRCIWACLSISIPLLAQQANDTVSGTVLNSETGEPVKYALVSLRSVPKFDPEHPPQQPVTPVQRSVQADGSGQFQFNGLTKGRYTLRAQKPGFNPSFTPQNPGSRQVDVDGSTSGVELRLAPLGVIEGRVVDQNNEPLQGVNIVALQVRINDGLRGTTSARSVATDDRGAFRLWNLVPGKYYLKAAGKSGGTYRYIGDGTPYYSSWQSFTPVYFGGGRTLDSATAIEIGAGTKVSADFKLTLEPAFKIRGTLANAPSGSITFDLLQGAEDVSASRTSLNANGRFEVQDVTPGAYTLRATQAGKMRGEVQVSVSDGDVSGVSISLAPAVTLTGATRIIGAPLTPRQLPGVNRMISALGADSADAAPYLDQAMEPTCNVTLREEGAGKISNSIARQKLALDRGNDADGGFTIADVLPGAYGVHVQCQGGYPLAVLSGGVDLLANPTLVIQSAIAPAPIEVQVKPGGGTLHAKVAIASLPQTAGVLLVPAFRNSSGPVMMEAGGEMLPAIGFMEAFLAPGDYSVYAFSNWPEIEFRNPAFLQTLTGGVSVHVEDGKEQEVSLTSVVK